MREVRRARCLIMASDVAAGTAVTADGVGSGMGGSTIFNEASFSTEAGGGADSCIGCMASGSADSDTTASASATTATASSTRGRCSLLTSIIRRFEEISKTRER